MGEMPRTPTMINLICKNCGQPFQIPLSFYRAERERRGGDSCSFCGQKCSQEYRARDAFANGTCRICGKEFRYQKTQYSGQYCSRKCKHVGHRKPDAWVEKTCDACGKQFKARTCSCGNKRYCSRKCARIAPHQVEKKCLICGTSFFVNYARADKAVACSRDCHHEWQRRYRRTVPLANSNRLQIKAWRHIRARILERDNHACQRCGATAMLHVHHIIPWVLMGPDNPSNLVTLCAQCHFETERPYREQFAVTA